MSARWALPWDVFHLIETAGLNEIAVAMGWSNRHASRMFEHYARLMPDVTDEILEKLERARASDNAFDGYDKDD